MAAQEASACQMRSAERGIKIRKRLIEGCQWSLTGPTAFLVTPEIKSTGNSVSLAMPGFQSQIRATCGQKFAYCGSNAPRFDPHFHNSLLIKHSPPGELGGMFQAKSK
jgi:hypothetical protein